MSRADASRRHFLKLAGAGVAGTALGAAASSYARIAGANDRVGVGKAGQRNALVGEELLDHRRVPGVHHERDIDLSRLELFRGFARAQRQCGLHMESRSGYRFQFESGEWE